MMPLQPNADSDPMTSRWNIGIDRRHAGVYIGLALLAGLAIGFAAGRYSLRMNESTDAAPALQAQKSVEGRPSELPMDTKIFTAGFHKVVQIIRADTAEIDGIGRVRMIGVESPDGKNPPEIYGVHGKNARAFAEKSMLSQDVRVDFDPAFAMSGNKDDTGQFLVYIYKKDGTLINGEMIKQGHAFLKTTDSFKMMEEFRSLEREAMQGLRGVWGLGGVQATASSSPPTPDGKNKKLSPLLPSELEPRISTPSEPMVYVSMTDRTYHKEGCVEIGKKRETMSLSEAKAKGYTACGRCFASTVLKAP